MLYVGVPAIILGLVLYPILYLAFVDEGDRPQDAAIASFGYSLVIVMGLVALYIVIDNIVINL